MEKNKLIWDICSGLGGASEAFIMAGWDVIRIENNEALGWVPKTQILNVLEWMDWIDDLIIEHGIPDMIWASPPCLEFSQAYAAPGPVAKREGRDFEPSLEIVFAIQDILDRVRPRHWIIENVAGACSHFAPIFGHHFQKVGPFFLWGRCPTIMVPDGWSHSKTGPGSGDLHSSDPMRANKRAYVPLILSQAVVEAVTHQTTLEEWC